MRSSSHKFVLPYGLKTVFSVLLLIFSTGTLTLHGQLQTDTIALDSISVDTFALDSTTLDTTSSDSTSIDSVLAGPTVNVFTDTLSILGTGDVMPGTNWPDNRYLPPNNDCGALFDPVRALLQDADVTFGNLEGVFASSGGEAKKCKNPKTCYVFRMPDSYLDCILEAGYDVLSVANNHINDFGVGGRVSTLKQLESSGVAFAGFQSRPSMIFEQDGVTYGFAAFAPHSGTANLKDYKGAARIVAGLDSVCDIVIVSFHGGAEGKEHQNTPCTDEVYLGYNRGNVCKFAHRMVEAGADLLFGHGPHVIRGAELYKERLICYSLGNFCTYARFNLSGPNGYAPMVKAYVDREGRFLEAEVISVRQTGEGGPWIDPNHGAFGYLKDLSQSDFPDNGLDFSETGRISVVPRK